MPKTNEYLNYFANAIWYGTQPSSTVIEPARPHFNSINDNFARRFIAALRAKQPANYGNIPAAVVEQALAAAIDPPLHYKTKDYVFDFYSGNLIPIDNPITNKIGPHPLYELTKQALLEDKHINMYKVMQDAHNLDPDTISMLKQKANKYRSQINYPAVKAKPGDRIKAFILSLPLLLVIVGALSLSFAPWALPFCIIAYSMLLYQLTNEMTMQRYLRKNATWLKSLEPTGQFDRKTKALAFVVETGFAAMCFLVGVGIAFGLGSGVGAIVMAYPLCHGIARSLGYKQRGFVTLMQNPHIIANRPESNFKARLIPLGLFLALLIFGLFTPPGLMMVASTIAAGLLVNLLAVTALMIMSNQLNLKGSVAYLADNATRHANFRTVAVPRHTPEPETETVDLADNFMFNYGFVHKNRPRYCDVATQTDGLTETLVDKLVDKKMRRWSSP